MINHQPRFLTNESGKLKVNGSPCLFNREGNGVINLLLYIRYMVQEIRWKQRLDNFEKAFLKFREAMDTPKLNELERDGLIQRFKLTLDLSWKVMKDFLEEKGFTFNPSPKDTIRLAQQNGFINYAQALIDGFDIRNELLHDYSGEKFEKAEKILRDSIYLALQKLYSFFLEKSKD